MKKTHAHIASHSDARTRLRVVSAHRTPADMEKFAAAIKTLPCVDKIQTNKRTGSILINHKGGTRDQFKGVFKDIGCILTSTISFDIPGADAVHDLPQAVADLDFRFGLIHSPFSLKNLIPLSLGTLAFIQMRRQGVQISTLPWYILAYLAYFTYTKLNKFDKVVEKVSEKVAH
jgi:hypothetical protein